MMATARVRAHPAPSSLTAFLVSLATGLAAEIASSATFLSFFPILRLGWCVGEAGRACGGCGWNAGLLRDKWGECARGRGAE